MKYTLEQMIQAGGKHWEQHGKNRVYFDNKSLVNLRGLKEINFSERKHKFWFDIDNNKFESTSEVFANALNN